MSLTEERLETLEHEPVVGDIDADALEGVEKEAPPETEEWETEPPLPPGRVGLVVGTTVVAAGAVVGTLFTGPPGKIHPILAGVAGIVVAAQASRRKSALVVNLTILFGIVGTGLLLVATSGLGNVIDLADVLKESSRARSVMRPPAEFLPGWRAIVGWMMATIGFTAGWVGIELRRPALGLLAPLPLIVMAAISVPASAKLGVGVAVLILFLVGLMLLSSLQSIVAGGEGSQAPGLGYELRRMARVVPLIGVIVIVIVVLARSGLLFPPPLYDPVRDAQRPKAVPLSEVEDRVLFEVRSRSTGPWRVGLLDVYDGQEWRLPPYAESQLERVPADGVVDRELGASTRADFLVKGLGGAVLPGLPAVVSIVATGPKLSYDPRTGAIRLAEGQIGEGLTYSVGGAQLPTEEKLRSVTFQLPKAAERFLDVPDPPPGIRSLLAEAPKETKWDTLEFLRKRLLETVTAAGPGTPVPVPPAKVEDMLFGSKEGSPFEIVAAQALLARWAGVPARIGYGYDGGEPIGENVLEVRPRHGASWLEVYFPTYKWFPLIGAPLKAKANLDSDNPTKQDPKVLPSDQVAVQVFIPLRIPERGFFYDQVRHIVTLLIPWLALAGLIWLVYPAVWKWLRRRRRRAWAFERGPVARLEVAYAEFRDLCTDIGIGSPSMTPLGFLDAFVDDAEHLELAWLVTRAVYGDMRDTVSLDDAIAGEELARSLRKRASQPQPLSIRLLAAVSRQSLIEPYAAEARPPTRRERKEAHDAVAA
ncbi:MAG TPA: transglutaminaseTgpA domain-containing protein [Actinomycetota bacterium]|nr:transglutaminaseTgpA domain-containing protein [Actinomycetota bacterium]